MSDKLHLSIRKPAKDIMRKHIMRAGWTRTNDRGDIEFYKRPPDSKMIGDTKYTMSDAFVLQVETELQNDFGITFGDSNESDVEWEKLVKSRSRSSRKL